MLHTINRPGSSAAYCPMALRKIQCVLISSMLLTMPHAVNEAIKLRTVKSDETIIVKPAQKLIEAWWPSRSASRTLVVTGAPLNSIDNSVDSSRDMKTMLLP